LLCVQAVHAAARRAAVRRIASGDAVADPFAKEPTMSQSPRKTETSPAETDDMVNVYGSGPLPVGERIVPDATTTDGTDETV
jgi:hypothetical protein